VTCSVTVIGKVNEIAIRIRVNCHVDIADNAVVCLFKQRLITVYWLARMFVLKKYRHFLNDENSPLDRCMVVKNQSCMHA
jgi:hypothetical protein